jgi:hypothetical protein
MLNHENTIEKQVNNFQAELANSNDYSRGDLVMIETYIDGPEFDANFILCSK